MIGLNSISLWPLLNESMKKLSLSLLLLCLIAGFYACDDDFEMISEYSDVTLVYGLLNQDSATYLRINKAFLGEENALVMAQVPDSSEYKNIDVYLDALNINGADTTLIHTITLETVTMNNKDSGLFYYPGQKVYYTSSPLEVNHTYKLRIQVNPNKIVTAFSNLIPDFTILTPMPYGEEINFLEDSPFPAKVKWNTPRYGKLYDVLIRFYYEEKSIGQDTIIRHFDWKIGTTESVDTQGGDDIQVLYDAGLFYELCAQRIPYRNEPGKEDNVSSRIPLRVDFIISIADEAFSTFMQVNNSNNSIAETLTEYTNVKNGLGLFASRYKKMRSKLLGLESYQILKTRNIKF